MSTTTTTTWTSTTTTSLKATLQQELDFQGLGLCHGILHASGVRCLADLQGLTPDHLNDMGVDSLDRREMKRVIHELKQQEKPHQQLALSTDVDGEFDRTPRKRFETVDEPDFHIQVVNEEHSIFKGRLFTKEQAHQIIRMAEYSAYRVIDTEGAGWGTELYTLTAQHLAGRDVPGFMPQTQEIFRALLRELYRLFPDRLVPGSIRFSTDTEPHLVKYSGAAKGTKLHIDNSQYVYITINVLLSSPRNDFHGGGTYIAALDETIQLEQGEMLIHLGDLVHAGAEITSGVRHLLIAFLACEWQDEWLNVPKYKKERREGD